MKKRRNYVHLFIMLMGLLMLCGTSVLVSADTGFKKVLIDGVEYSLDLNDRTAKASIDKVRGDNLATKLSVPRKIKYENVKYKVTDFSWGDLHDYMIDDRIDYQAYGDLSFADTWYWKEKVEIPDKGRSYQACLKRITFDKGVKVSGVAYGYDKLRKVILEDPNDLEQAFYNFCPKLERLHFPAKLWRHWDYNIKNCPSLKVTIDKRNKKLKMVGNDICSKNGYKLLNVVAGKKNYKVPKGVTLVSDTAFWGNTAIETVHLRKAAVGGMGGLGLLPNLKKVKRDNGDDFFSWGMFTYSPNMERIDLPESTRYIYDGKPYHRPSVIKHVYLYSKRLKDGTLENIPTVTTFHVRSKKVANQLRKFGFKGSIVIEKNMKWK